MASPVCVPLGHRFFRSPQICVTFTPLKPATQTVSSPSTAMPQGPRVLGTVYCVVDFPPGLIRVTLWDPRFATHTLSFESTATPCGERRPPPSIGEFSDGVPAG